jgi:prevent-host-death family protein
MKKMAVSEFKARCLRVMDEVRNKRETVLITKKGRPVARVVPVGDPPTDIFGCLTGVVEITGDIEGSVVPLSDWSNRADPSRH